MKPDEITHKLKMIEQLTLLELRGWWQTVILDRQREPFHGEKQALEARAKKLGAMK